MADVSPMIQTVLGGAMTLAGGAVVQLLTFWRERNTRRHDAEEHRNRQRADFQIKTLTELQEALCQLMESVYPLADIDYHDTFSGVVRDQKKASRLWKEWQGALSRGTVCSARVQDPQVRERMKDILEMAHSLVIPIRRKSDDLEEAREETEEMREKLYEKFKQLNQRIGECLLELY
jgi:hypothetical protein